MYQAKITEHLHGVYKAKITEYIHGLYSILRESGYIQITPYEFQKKWLTGGYRKGVSLIGIDILHAALVQDIEHILSIRDTLRVNFSGSIETMLNAHGYILGKVSKPRHGFARFSWEMLEKLRFNDIEYFYAIYLKINNSNKKNNKNT